MNVVIIEDEKPAYNRLSKMLKEINTDIQIAAHFDSIRDTESWFTKHTPPDLLILDIHLADGSAFDLLKRVNITCPIIYTTAYDQYAIDAFKTNGIDYLLKPVKKDELQNALHKFENIKALFDKKEIIVTAPPHKEYKSRFFIRFGEHIKTLQVHEVAYFFSENKATFARTFENRTYPMDNNLDALEDLLDPEHFFRINRQYLINLKAIDDMKTYSKARVIVTLKPPVKELPVVSSERSAEFKQWLGGD